MVCGCIKYFLTVAVIQDKIHSLSLSYKQVMHNLKHPGLLTVEAKVLGERLGAEHFKAQGDKVADSPGIFLQTAWGESLISRVKEHKQLPPLEKDKTISTLWYNMQIHVRFKLALYHDKQRQ